MITWKAARIRKRAAHAYQAMSASRLRHRDVFERFAKQHHLTFFSPDTPQRMLEMMDHERTEQTHGLLVGEHADYMTTVFSYTAKAHHFHFVPTEKAWMEVQIELLHATELPFVYIGTRQQTNTQYAELLSHHKDARYLHISCPPALDKRFHERYAVLAATEHAGYVRDLFTDSVVEALVDRHDTTAYHIEGNLVRVVTELQKPRIQTLDRLFHTGLWMAKLVDDMYDDHNETKNTAV